MRRLSKVEHEHYDKCRSVWTDFIDSLDANKGLHELKTRKLTIVPLFYKTSSEASGIRINLLVQNIAPDVVLVGDRLIGDLIVLPRQAVCRVVFIGDRGRSLRDFGYVPVVVIGVRIRRVAAVPVC